MADLASVKSCPLVFATELELGNASTCGVQSVSVADEHPVGQQPSAEAHVVMAV